MSGNNGGGGNFGGGGGGASVSCQDISIKTSIISPDPAILAIINVDDILNISLRTNTGPLIATTNAGQILGAIFTTNPTLLIDCINQGYSYQATILSISGGDCQVLITVA